MKIKELIKILEDKPQDDDVQFVIVRDDGTMTALELKGKNIELTKILKLFVDVKGTAK